MPHPCLQVSCAVTVAWDGVRETSKTMEAPFHAVSDLLCCLLLLVQQSKVQKTATAN